MKKEVILLLKFLINTILITWRKLLYGSYLTYEDNVYLCKLRNRGLEKNQELKNDLMSYSILGETVMQLPKHPNENSIISDIRTIYSYLKLAVDEGIQTNNFVFDSIPFEFEGDRIKFKKMLKILEEIKVEFEEELTNRLCGRVNIKICAGSLKNKKAVVFMKIREAY